MVERYLHNSLRDVCVKNAKLSTKNHAYVIVKNELLFGCANKLVQRRIGKNNLLYLCATNSQGNLF